MKREEHETVVNFDYYEDLVDIYTTRKGVRNGVERRIPEDRIAYKKVIRNSDGREIAWRYKLPMELCRDAHLITRPEKGT